MAGLPFDVERDFAPITILATAPNLIVASPKLGVTTVVSLIEKGKTQQLTYGSPGVGSQLHLATELLKEKTGVNLVHVPYRGSLQAFNDLLGDHIDSGHRRNVLVRVTRSARHSHRGARGDFSGNARHS